ncbi:rhamnogalacturonan acetylesterase [Marinimicrobium alkaliphilum]|uniref:rhamnogalacturonan acetylesterase n=1 Tax=Marinimicrobium alkaliphilum TaxID=2202654 RepID=UPI000DB96AA8|nr:rhamnogalacturonan acetylesterase [Marinimicrobium alkaliphilum]
MKTFAHLAASILLGVLLTACGSSNTETTDQDTSGSSSSDVSSSSDASSSSAAALDPVTIHMIGDSTMTEYPDRRPQAGWGEMVHMFYNDDVTVVNWARGGRSSRSFYYETGRWPATKAALAEGDYVIIQFGHNDQKRGGDYDEFGTYAFCSDGSTDGEGCADTEHSYYQFLKKYVMEAREQGATPILMTPMVRKYFSGTSINETGQHNLTSINSGETFPRGSYTAAMKAVAETYDVPLVDVTEETRIIVESYGNTAATEYLYIAADSTHPTELFATLIAKRAVGGLSALNVLADYTVEVSSVITSPTEIDWVKRYTGTSTNRTLTVSAFDLDPASGSVIVTAPEGFQVSHDQQDWQSELSIDYQNGDFMHTVNVSFNPEEEKVYSETLILSLLGEQVASVALMGEGVGAGTGLASHVSWFTDPDSLAPETDGPVNATDAVAVNLVKHSNRVFSIQEEGSDLTTDKTIARYVANNHTGRPADEYLLFEASAANGSFAIDTISAYLTSSGGSTVRADMEYSLTSDFSNPIKLNEDPLFFTANTMTKVEFQVIEQLSANASLYLRIYTWNAADNDGKFLAVYDVQISGLAED